MADSTYTLGEPASGVYDTLARKRQAVIDIARDMAELTIPSVFPPDGYQPGDRLPGNNQSIGAWCVNSLASHLMFMAFPPGRPMLRFEIVEHKLREEIDQDPEMWSKIKLALSRKELEHRRRASTTPLGSAYTGFIKQLLVSGNCLWHHIKLTSPSYHRCDTYVVKRDTGGHPLTTILKERVSLQALEEDVRNFVLAKSPDIAKASEWEQSADIFTVCKLDREDGEQVWHYWQEFEGEVIPDTEVTTDYDTPPMYPAWLIPVYGEDWGRSYCEEYRGDLYLVENHASAINDGSAAAALTLLFVRPGARTSVRQVKEAENLAVLSGAAEDVSALTLGKSADYQFVANNLQEAGRRLARAFLTHSSIQRDAERVTAEEWQRMGRELDMAMGGLYTELAQSGQRHVVLRFVRLHEEDDPEMPELPEGVVRTAVVTGVDALGATTEEQALVTFVETLTQAFGGSAAQFLNPTDFARRLAAEKGIQPEGLVKDERQLAAEEQAAQQRAQQQALLEKGTGPAIKAASDSVQSQQQ